ncbi:MAG: hypothetical protein DWQ19_12925 [Crenarchaeota archaeon]|nr:MAG: hypothetical protein DWQ19_12925 [Thermoproteota archaeon]
MPEYLSVITIKDGVVWENKLFVGENGIIASGLKAGQKLTAVGEEYFLAKCREYDPDFDKEFSPEEWEYILDDGYYETDTATICICNPV